MREIEKNKNETGVLRDGGRIIRKIKKDKKIRKLKKSRLEPYRDEIENYLKIGVSISNIKKLINSKYNLDYVYTTYVHYIRNIMR